MHVAVIGGGVIGTTSAYALLEAGCRVTLIDRERPRDGVATDVNAGLIAPGHALAWATPKMLRKLPAVLTNRTPQVRVRAHLDPALIRWGATFVRNCTTAHARRSTLIRGELGRRSCRLLHQRIAEEGIDCGLTEGLLFVHTDASSLAAQLASMKALRTDGHELELIDRRRCLELEPALADSEIGVVGAIHHPAGASADSAAFTSALRARASSRGLSTVRADVTELQWRSDRVVAATTSLGEDVTADSFVVASGSHSPSLLGRHGQRLRMYPVRGYGLTWSGLPDDVGPCRGGIDENALIAWSRQGIQLRVTGIAEFNRFRHDLNPGDTDGVRRAALRLFPAIADLGEPVVGSGFRPMTADGLPRIGRFAASNLYVNTGHGNLGWTMSAASAEILADAVLDRREDPLSRALQP